MDGRRQTVNAQKEFRDEEMDSRPCVRAYLGGRWVRRTAAVCAAVRTGRNTCAGPNPGSGYTTPTSRHACAATG